MIAQSGSELLEMTNKLLQHDTEIFVIGAQLFTSLSKAVCFAELIKQTAN